MYTKEEAISWHLAINVASLATRRGGFWEIDANKHKSPDGYCSDDQANVTLDNNEE
jgi:hypothetical protein